MPVNVGFVNIVAFDSFVTFPKLTWVAVTECGLLVLLVCFDNVVKLAVICACNFPSALKTVSVALITVLVANDIPVKTVDLTAAKKSVMVTLV